MFRYHFAATVLATLILQPLVSHAAVITYDFESVGSVENVTSLPYTVSGLTMTISRSSGAIFDVDGRSGAPASFGDWFLDPFDSLPTGDSWILDFSTPIESLFTSFGDFGQDSDSPVTAMAYTGLGGTGALVDSDSESWGAGVSFPSFKTLSVSGSGINSVALTSFPTSTAFPNSLFWDNIVVSVPEPTSMVLLGLTALGGLGVGYRRRRKGEPAAPSAVSL